MKTAIPGVLAILASFGIAACLLAGQGAAPSQGSANRQVGNNKISTSTVKTAPSGGSAGSAGSSNVTPVISAGNASIGTAGYPSHGSAWGKTVSGSGSGLPTDGRPVQFDVYCGLNNTVPLTVHYINSATFVMGCSSLAPVSRNFYSPVYYYRAFTGVVPENMRQHVVKISKPYRLGVYEVTHAQWNAVMNDTEANNPAYYKQPGGVYNNGDYLARPQENITQAQALDFCKKLLALNKSILTECRLPTEAEWELACRNALDQLWAAPPTTYIYGYSMPPVTLGNYCWYNANGGTATHTEWATSLDPVKMNLTSFSLFNMGGNVMEWCMDWYEQNYGIDFSKDVSVTDPNKPLNKIVISDGNTYTLYTDPTGPSNAIVDYTSPSYGAGKVCRGGAFRDVHIGAPPIPNDFPLGIWPFVYLWDPLLTGDAVAMASAYRFCWPVPPQDNPMAGLHVNSQTGPPSQGGWAPDNDLRFRSSIIGFRVYVQVLPLTTKGTTTITAP